MFEDTTVQAFKAHFTRDFPYLPNPIPEGTIADQYVKNSDIEKAIQEAIFNVNPALFDSQESYSLCFNYLTAHYLVTDLRNSAQGLFGQYNWMTSSKSVGSVSEGYSIPQKILDNPEFAYISTTPYGAKYLSMIMPLLTGGIVPIGGATSP